MQYKIGDKVKIKEDVHLVNFKGKIGTVTKVFDMCYGSRLYEIDKSPIISEEDIEGIFGLKDTAEKERVRVNCDRSCGRCTCKEVEERKFEVVSSEFRKYPDEEIILPQRGDDGSAGYDLRVPCEVIIKPHSHSELIFTDVRVKMHKDEYLQLHVRSSIGCKKGLVLANATGIIDYSYYYSDNQGNIGVKFYNTTDKIVRLEKGERVCQGIFQKYYIIDNDRPLKECRTGSGFGSSGEK